MPNYIGFFLKYLVILRAILIATSSGATLKLFTETGIHEVNSRQCRSGAFMLEPTSYTCACVTGVWGFYSKFCKTPITIIGGDNYCVKFNPSLKLSQAIPLGNVKYPFLQSLTHFREDYIIMTKAYTTDHSQVDLDATSTFVSVTGRPWTIRDGSSKSMCLNGTGENSRRYCMFNLANGIIEDWVSITDIERGCHSGHVYQADNCYEILPSNDEVKICERGRMDTPEPPTESPDEGSSTSRDYDTTTDLSTSPTMTTTEMPDVHCELPVEKADVRSYWESPLVNSCPRSIIELVFTDQLKRFAILQMNREVKTRQLSLEQTEELLILQASLMKQTCPDYAVPSEFIDVATEAFGLFIREDFFYGIPETDRALFERMVYALRSCVHSARPFEFTNTSDECNTTIRIHDLIVDGSVVPISLSEANRWQNYEPLIESGWKMFLNAHSYCYEYFLRQNDHHAYAVRMMQLFSMSIYEKWTQPLQTLGLYKFIVPEANTMEVTMDNLDQCVAALSYNKKCPVWLDRNAHSDIVTDLPSNSLTNELSRKKRSIWVTHLQNRREETRIWNGMAHCLQTPEDPSYFLGFGRCAHP